VFSVPQSAQNAFVTAGSVGTAVGTWTYSIPPKTHAAAWLMDRQGRESKTTTKTRFRQAAFSLESSLLL